MMRETFNQAINYKSYTEAFVQNGGQYKVKQSLIDIDKLSIKIYL